MCNFIRSFRGNSQSTKSVLFPKTKASRPQSGRLRLSKTQFGTLGMHEGTGVPSYLRPGLGFARPGFRFANNVCEPPAAQSAAFEIRRTGFAGSRSGPSGRFLYHFPAVTEGDRKMMQLEKMNILNVHCKCNR